MLYFLAATAIAAVLMLIFCAGCVLFYLAIAAADRSATARAIAYGVGGIVLMSVLLAAPFYFKHRNSDGEVICIHVRSGHTTVDRERTSETCR